MALPFQSESFTLSNFDANVLLSTVQKDIPAKGSLFSSVKLSQTDKGFVVSLAEDAD